MEIESLIDDILNMPTIFHELGNVSYYTLLKNSGYFEKCNQISENDILKRIIRNPECVEQWLIYSEDQRSSPSWYIAQQNNNEYLVDRYPQLKSSQPRKFLDVNEACAAFVKVAIEQIRKI